MIGDRSDSRIQHRERINSACFPINVLILVIRYFSPLYFSALRGIPRKTPRDALPQYKQVLGERSQGREATCTVSGEG